MPPSGSQRPFPLSSWSIVPQPDYHISNDYRPDMPMAGVLEVHIPAPEAQLPKPQALDLSLGVDFKGSRV